MKFGIRKSGLVLPLLLFMRIASGATANLAFLFAAFYALRSRRHAIEALFLVFVFLNLNTGMFPSASLANATRYMVVLAAFLSVFGRDIASGQLVLSKVTLPMLLFGGYTFVHAVLFSLFPIISALKILIWMLAFITLLRAWTSISEVERQKVETTIYMVLSLLIVLSVFSIVLPQAYLPRTTLLRGLLGHSQALGSTAVFVAVWSFMRSMARPRPSWIDLAVFSFSVLAILSSGTRTALLTLVLTLVIVVLLAMLGMGQLTTRSFTGLRSKRVALIGGIGTILLLTQIGRIRDVLVKGTSEITGGQVDLATLYILSRGSLIGEMWENIRIDPFVGIGFGLASRPEEMVVQYAGGIPIGATVEKGITLLAIWEEIGIIGLILFLVMMTTIFLRSVSVQPQGVAVFVAILLVNFGEGSLMSAGGVGLLQLVLLGWIVSGQKAQARESSSAPTRTKLTNPAAGKL